MNLDGLHSCNAHAWQAQSQNDKQQTALQSLQGTAVYLLFRNNIR